VLRLFHIVFILMFSLTPGVQAQDRYPDYENIYINDYASIVTARDERYIRRVLRELRDETGIEFTVLTINTMRDYNHYGAIEPFATGLFNSWGIGDATRNDGVLMLVARHDREMRLEVGSGYGTRKDGAMKRIIDNYIIPEFKENRYSQGIREGVDEVIFNLVGHYPGEYDSGAISRGMTRFQKFAERFWGLLVALMVPVAGWFYWLYRKWQRNKPRYCSRDGSRMIRLDEQNDDEHLNPGRLMEENLESVDYDVWACQKCSRIKIESYRSLFTQYGGCRKCRYRTREADTTTLEKATTSSTGRERIDYLCHNCGDAYSVTKTIPRITKSSSSSSGGGGSFGGGSSSGGGASGSW